MNAPSARVVVEGENLRVAVAGAWTLAAGAGLEAAGRQVEAAPAGGDAALDLSGLEALDTAGAWVISRSRRRLEESGRAARLIGARPEHATLLRAADYEPPAVAPARPRGALTLLADVGESVYGAGRDGLGVLDFLGRVVLVGCRAVARPRSWRLTSTAFHFEQMGLRGAPLILMINFFVGAIVAQQGIVQLARFGASSLTTDLVAILTLRELGVMLTSIMVAGRSGSAITAELGAMNMREEIDALRVMALDPLEALVLPRLMALVLALPLLTFLGDIAALTGGMLVAWGVGGVSPHAFWAELQYPASIQRFASGLAKAPFMAMAIGLIASLEGFAVQGSAESLGRRVTASVVKAIFAVILLDGVFAMFYAAVRFLTDIPAIRVRALEVGFGEKLVMRGLDLDLRRGEVLGFVGASGAGKSVLTRAILGLQPKRAGTIEADGRDLDAMNPTERAQVERGWGVLFQQGALFSSLTVRQNVEAPMREHLDISPALRTELATMKLRLVGLAPDAAEKLPSELSGGMVKRAALARALALDPGVLFLDEPTAGLDPISAGAFDELIATLQATLGLTVFMVTHDLDSLYAICDRVAVLGRGQVIAIGAIPELLQSEEPWIREYFHGPRGAGRELNAQRAPAA